MFDGLLAIIHGPYAHVRDLEALDHYYALMGLPVQSLAKKATIAAVDGSSRKTSARIRRRKVAPYRLMWSATEPIVWVCGSVGVCP